MSLSIDREKVFYEMCPQMAYIIILDTKNVQVHEKT